MRTRDSDLNQERRKTILEAAATCFVGMGFHATSMKDICAAAKMSPGTLYHYYASKSEIVAGIVDQEGRFIGDLLARLEKAEDFLESLGLAISETAARTSERELALHAEIGAEVLRRPALRESAVKIDQETVAGLEAAIARAILTGKIDGTINAHRAAVAIAMLIDGWLWQGALKGPDWLREQTGAITQAAMALLRPEELSA